MSKVFFNTVLALLLVGAGVFLLLINLGILPLDMLEVWEYFYPLVFMALGGKWILDGFSSRRRYGHSEGWFWGLAFITVGSLLLLNKLDIITFTLGMVWRLWPLLLIYFGISLIGGRKKNIILNIDEDFTTHSHYDSRGKKNSSKTADSPPEDHYTGEQKEWDDSKEYCGGSSNFIRTAKFNQHNWTVKPMELWQGVGDYHFDFSRAFIPEKETLIKLSGWVGDIDIFLPGDVAFKIDAQANVGDLDVLGRKHDGLNPYFHFKTQDYDEAERKLAFDFDFKVLDLHIKRV